MEEKKVEPKRDWEQVSECPKCGGPIYRDKDSEEIVIKFTCQCRNQVPYYQYPYRRLEDNGLQYPRENKWNHWQLGWPMPGPIWIVDFDSLPKYETGSTNTDCIVPYVDQIKNFIPAPPKFKVETTIGSEQEYTCVPGGTISNDIIAIYNAEREDLDGDIVDLVNEHFWDLA